MDHWFISLTTSNMKWITFLVIIVLKNSDVLSSREIERNDELHKTDYKSAEQKMWDMMMYRYKNGTKLFICSDSHILTKLIFLNLW